LELAENNDNHAMVSLGSMYYEGRGVQQSYKKAVYWYEKAAEKLDPRGLCYLGYCYYYGRDIDVDYKKAYACFSQSAFLKDPNGMFKLGDMFYFGLYVKEDKDAAFYWYDAADNVYSKTQYESASIEYRLGKCYLYGEGVEQNLSSALRKLQSAEEDFFELVEEGDTNSAITLKSVRKEIDTVRNKLYDLHNI
jgi:TPR repeat protein